MRLIFAADKTSFYEEYFTGRIIARQAHAGEAGVLEQADHVEALLGAPGSCAEKVHELVSFKIRAAISAQYHGGLHDLQARPRAVSATSHPVAASIVVSGAAP